MKRPSGNEPPPVTGEPADDEPKQWELRAAWRAFERTKDGRNRRNPAQQVVDAAWALVEEQDDFTVKQVAERAGVALQTFYRHFGSKDELALAMMEESIERGSTALAEAVADAHPRDRMRSLIEEAIARPEHDPVSAALRRRRLRWSARERQRLAVRFPHEVNAVHESYRAAVLQVLQEAVKLGIADVDDDVLTANVIQQTVLTMAHVVASGVIDATPDEVADAVVALCWRGVTGRPSGGEREAQ